MKEILTQLLFASLTICSPLVTAYIHKAAAAIDASTAEKVKTKPSSAYAARSPTPWQTLWQP